MTSPRTPEEEPGGGQTRADAPDDLGPGAPPPPQWLDDPENSGSTPLLPEAPPFPTAPEPEPAPADKTVSDLSRYLPPKAPEEPPEDETRVEDETRAEPIPAAEPATQQIPARPAPEPFPYAQQIPEAPPVPPWSQPEAPPAPPAPEPFPYAQEIPPARPAPEPFPYAQQLPGPPPQAEQPVPPIAPPPQINEPWRTAPQSAGKRRSGKVLKRVLLIGGAGLAAVALVAGGIVAVSALTGGDEGSTGDGAQLARSLFPVDASTRTDGHDQELGSVAAVGPTVVAVGGETGAQGSRGVFLASADGGRTFKAATVRGSDDDSSAPGVPSAVGGSANGWVAIGSRSGGNGAVWTSQNGQEWLRQPDAVGDVFGRNTRVKKVVASGAGFLAIGERSAKGDFSDSVPAVWLSGDGRRWEQRTDDQIGLQVRNGNAALVEAAAGGNVIVLEALITPDRGQGGFRRTWRSDDGGRTWGDSPVPVPNGARGLMIGGGPAGFVAVREMRSGGNGYGQVYVSRDGRTWQETGRLETPGYRVTNQLLGDDKGFAAVVFRGADVLVSRSADGRAWRDAGTLQAKPGLLVQGAALAGDSTVVAGREPGGGDLDPLLSVWDASGGAFPVDLTKIPGAFRSDHTVASIAAGTDRVVSVGSAAGDAAAWTSQDGATWRPAQGLGAAFTRPGTQQLVDVSGGGAGWVAVGYDQTAPRRPLVVTSADGATWQAVDSAAPFRGGSQGEPVTAATASAQAGYVIVGTDGPSAAAWFSTDLKDWERGRSANGDGALEGKGSNTRWMLGATGGAFGFTAVGGTRDAKSGNRPAVWSSADGKQWTLQQLPLPNGASEGHLTHVAAQGNTLVAAGIAATQQGLVWLGYVSPDAGKTWQSLQVPGGDPKVTLTSLTGTPKGFAATATSGQQGTADVAAWTSADGSSWTASKPEGDGLSGDGDQQITGLAPFKDRLLGIGRTTTQNDAQPVLWSRPIP